MKTTFKFVKTFYALRYAQKIYCWLTPDAEHVRVKSHPIHYGKKNLFLILLFPPTILPIPLSPSWFLIISSYSDFSIILKFLFLLTTLFNHSALIFYSKQYFETFFRLSNLISLLERYLSMIFFIRGKSTLVLNRLKSSCECVVGCQS